MDLLYGSELPTPVKFPFSSPLFPRPSSLVEMWVGLVPRLCGKQWWEFGPDLQEALEILKHLLFPLPMLDVSICPSRPPLYPLHPVLCPRDWAVFIISMGIHVFPLPVGFGQWEASGAGGKEARPFISLVPSLRGNLGLAMSLSKRYL